MDAIAKSPRPPETSLLPQENGGLAWGYRFSETGAPESKQAHDLLAALARQDSWLWLHFDLLDNRAGVTIAALPHLPRGALEMLCSAEERQQIDGFGQVIGGVVGDCDLGDIPGKTPAARWNFVMTPYAFISASRHTIGALKQLHLDLQSGRRMPNVLALFHAIVQELGSAISLALNQLGAQLNEMEEQLLDQKDVGSDLLGQLRRRIIRVRRQALPLRGLLIHMLSERPYWFNGDAVVECQRVTARMDGLVDDLDSLQERAHAIQDELKAREAEKTTRRLTVLAMVSALLLPPTLIAGVFGMNVEGLPFQSNAYGFWIACALMLGSIAGMLFVVRRIQVI